MKKSVKILLIITSLIVVIIAAVALSISPIAKHYVEKHSIELTGRQISMDRLHINIFTGRLRIENIRMLEAGDSAAFASIGKYDMKMSLWPLIKRKVTIRSITIDQPNLNIYQDGPQFNFDDLLLRFLSDTTQTDQAPSTPWEVGIDNILIDQGHIFYKDIQIGATWEFNDLDITVPGIYFKDKTDVDVVFNFVQGGSLGLNMNYDMDNSDYDLIIKLKDLALNGRLPYVQQTLNARSINGLLSADLHVNGNLQDLMGMYLDGSVDLANFALEDPLGDQVIKADSLHVGLTRASVRNNQFHFSRLYLLGMEGHFKLYKDGSNNISALIKEQPTAISQDEQSQQDTTSTEALDLRIEDIEIARGIVRLSDESHLKPFTYQLSNIRMKSSFDMNKLNRIVIDAQVQKTGRARIRWEGSLSDMDNHNIILNLTNIDLKDFTPYCEHYTAYPLTHGNLSFTSQNIIKNRVLNGTNHLDVFEPTVEKKRKDVEPEFNIPLKLGLYVLKDKKGHVKIDLPVKGSIDNPDFSYRKIIIKTLGNVMLKVVTSPFSFLSGGDNLEYISIEPLQRQFSSEQYAKFDKLAEMLRDKPDMKIALTQRIDYPEALQTQAENNLKLAYHNHLRQGDTTVAYTPLTMVEYEQVRDMKLHTEAIMLFADSLIRTQGGDPARLHAADKAQKLYGPQAATQIAAMLERRNAALKNYIVDMQGIPADAIHIATMPDAELHAYTGKSRYTIALEVDGETVEIAENPDDLATAQQAMGLDAVTPPTPKQEE